MYADSSSHSPTTPAGRLIAVPCAIQPVNRVSVRGCWRLSGAFLPALALRASSGGQQGDPRCGDGVVPEVGEWDHAWVLTTDEASVERARAVASVFAELLGQHGVPGELTLTGGSSLPGLVTKGDIDLHLRVVAADFDDAVERLSEVADAAHPDIWTDSFATFERSHAPIVGVAVTVVGSEHDVRFTSGWAHLAAHPDAREEYNALKRRVDYEGEKSRFFDTLSAASARTSGTAGTTGTPLDTGTLPRR